MGFDLILDHESTRQPDEPLFFWNAEFFHQVMEGRAVDAEFHRGLCQISAVASQGFYNQLFFQGFTGLLEPHGLIPGAGAVISRSSGISSTALGHDYSTLDVVFQLPDVSGPVY